MPGPGGQGDRGTGGQGDKGEKGSRVIAFRLLGAYQFRRERDMEG